MYVSPFTLLHSLMQVKMHPVMDAIWRQDLGQISTYPYVIDLAW
jgi:hypothetical protein